MTSSLLKPCATFFLMCRQLQRHEINLILKVSIIFDSFLLQNFVLMCCELKMISWKVLSFIKTKFSINHI